MIPDATIAEVRARADVVRVVGRAVDLKKAGTLFKGLCPFHDERTPSFTVSPTRNTYHCFGCGAHGDALRFLTEHEALSFPEAVRALAAEVGVEVPESRAESPEERQAREAKRSLAARLLAAQDKITAYFTEALHGPRGGAARAYLKQRGITRRTAEAFRLGWASGDKAAFAGFLEADGDIALDDLVTLGLLVPPDEGFREGERLGGGYLRFRERVMFPVIDIRGEVVGFSGRILDPHKKAAKYINSPETPVFTKGEHLYGAHTARHAARRAGRLVLCEGNVDVVMVYQAGIEGVAAAMGTALTPAQVRLVKRLSEKVVCVMDGDAAGAKAAFASLVPFLEAGLQPRAVMLPAGEDPDSFVRAQGLEAFEGLVEAAPPLLDLYISRARDEHPADPPGRVAALRHVAPALAALDDALTLTLYRRKVAGALEVDDVLVDQAIDDAKRAAAESQARSAGRRSALRDGAAPPRAAEPSAPPPDVPFAVHFEPPPPPPEPVPYDLEPPPFLGDGPAAGGPGRADAPPQPVEVRPLRVPRYARELFEFIVQYPHLAARLDVEDAHICLTHEGLAGFVDGLCREVEAGRTPNVDRLLSNLRDADVVAFLRECQARRPSQDGSTIEQAFDDAHRRVRQGSLEAEDRRIRDAMRAAWREDRAAYIELAERLKSIRVQLKHLQSPSVEGAR